MLAETRILIADDHPIVRHGLRQMIESEPDLKVVAEAAQGRTALEKVQELAPEIAILDIEMPELDGIAVMREISRRKLSVEVIFMTICRDDEAFQEAIELGAKGYVLKDSAASDIVSGIRAVLADHIYISPAMTGYLIPRRSRARAKDEAQLRLATLTTAERQILKMIAEYKTSKSIAEGLHVSPRTVESHRTNICNKLAINGRHALMKFALTHKPELFS